MTEMGIQMELTSRRSGVMRRAVMRRPRVNSNSKPEIFSLQSSDGSHNTENDEDVEQEYDQVNIDLSVSIEDQEYYPSSHKYPLEAVCNQRTSSTPPNSGNKRLPSRRKKKNSRLTNRDKFADELKTSHNENRMGQEIITVPSRNKTKKYGHVRAMSLDTVFPQKGSDFSHTHELKPGIEFSGCELTGPNYDPGSQILESYSDGLQYSSVSPKLSRKKRVKTFFRRLAGSLESLLGIKKKHEMDQFEQNLAGTQMHPAYRNPLVATEAPYVSKEERYTTELVASIETTISREGDGRDNNVFGLTKQQTKVATRDSSEATFHRGKRVYMPSVDRSEKSLNSTMTPVPPRKPSGKQRAFRKTRTRGSHLGSRSRAEYVSTSQEWETRSDTDDSEGLAFQSNRLAALGRAFQSDDEDNDKSVYLGSSKCLDDAPDSQLKLMESKEAVTQRNIPVKISDFRPPGNLSRQMLNQRHSRTPSGGKGPMRALRTSGEQNPMLRSESTGKFDGSSKRFMKRKVRRRNSSFEPGDQGTTHVLTETALKEAISFEQIMSSINDLANKLEDKVNMSTTPQTSIQGIISSQAPTIISDQEASVPATARESVPLSRNQSWVGKVSHRLDDLIDSVDSGSGNTSSKEKLPPESSKQPHLSVVKTNVRKKQVKKRRSNVVRKEKISFDELESDFKNFAKQVREKRQSSERVNAIGQ